MYAINSGGVKLMRYLLALLFIFLVGCSEKDKVLTEKIKLTQGDLYGYELNTVNVFEGIPYAKPPINDLRWKPPVKHNGWDKDLLAIEMPHSCMQPTEYGLNAFIGLWIEGSGMNWFSKKLIYLGAGLMPFLNGEANQSEDCLYLNIVTPKIINQKLPVMMWIHGGGYRYGNGSGSYLNKDLVTNNVILVSINYRLGSMGYFAHPYLSAESKNNSSGNYGTLDQIHALKWIKDNIEAFGGDPDNITIFGESAGGHSVRQLMSSPLSKGLFHKAIAQSSYGIRNYINLKTSNGSVKSAEDAGRDFVKTLGIREDENLLNNLRKISAENLIQVGSLSIGENVTSEDDWQISSYWMPVVDGWVFEDSDLNVSRYGKTHNVPLLIGFNSFEGSSLLPLFYTKEQNKNDSDWTSTIWNLAITDQYTKIPSEYIDWAKNIKLDKYLASQKLWGDLNFGSSSYYSAINHSKVNADTYFYYFNRAPASSKQIIGATHGAEIMYLFNSFIPGWPKNNIDDDIGKQMRLDWTNFAKTGDLSKFGWPRFSDQQTMQMNYQTEMSYTKIYEENLFKSMNYFYNNNLKP